MEKKEGGPLPNTINKIKSKWIKDLNIKLLNSQKKTRNYKTLRRKREKISLILISLERAKRKEERQKFLLQSRCRQEPPLSLMLAQIAFPTILHISCTMFQFFFQFISANVFSYLLLYSITYGCFFISDSALTQTEAITVSFLPKFTCEG